MGGLFFQIQKANTKDKRQKDIKTKGRKTKGRKTKDNTLH